MIGKTALSPYRSDSCADVGGDDGVGFPAKRHLPTKICLFLKLMKRMRMDEKSRNEELRKCFHSDDDSAGDGMKLLLLTNCTHTLHGAIDLMLFFSNPDTFFPSVSLFHSHSDKV